MKGHIREAIRRSLRQLREEDGCLFACPIEEDFGYDARKLHEVCINHRFANHLEKEILPLLREGGRMFVDIEFNREGVSYKGIAIDGEEQRVRPDIIIHNRKTGEAKVNFLVVECKKAGSRREAIDSDSKKIRALMTDGKYDYSFGLQVVYGTRSVRATLFAKDSEGIEEEIIE